MSDHTPHPDGFNPDEHDIGDIQLPSPGSTPTPEQLFPEHVAETKKVLDQIMFGDPATAMTKQEHVELPPELDAALAAAEEGLAAPEILPGKKEYDLTESQATPESMADVIRQGTPSPEVAEIRAREGRTTKEGPTPMLNPEQDEQQPLLAEVHDLTNHELALMKRIQAHEEDTPAWLEERDNVERTLSTVHRAYNQYRAGNLSAQDLGKEIRYARTVLDGYDLMFSSETK